MSARSQSPRRRSTKRELNVIATAVPREQPDIPRLIRLLLDFARQHDLARKQPATEEVKDDKD